MRISGDLSRCLMAANLIGTLLVVGIHYRSGYAVEGVVSHGWNYTFQEFVLNGIARSAVPLFSMISGFFLAGRRGGVPAYLGMLRGKAKTLLVPYLIGASCIFLSTFFLKLLLGRASYSSLSIYAVVRDLMIQPASTQFWFLRDLMLLLILSPILFTRKMAIAWIVMLVSGGLWLFEIQPFPRLGSWYLLNIEALFFFCAGRWIYERRPFLEGVIKAGPILKLGMAAVWFFLIGLRIYIRPEVDIWYVRECTPVSLLLYKAAILAGIISIMQLSSLIAANRWVIHFSGMTFFVYLYHMEPLSSILRHKDGVLTSEYGFYLMFPLVVIPVFTAAQVISTYMPGFYELISGGRSPEKARRRTVAHS